MKDNLTFFFFKWEDFNQTADVYLWFYLVCASKRMSNKPKKNPLNLLPKNILWRCMFPRSFYQCNCFLMFTLKVKKAIFGFTVKNLVSWGFLLKCEDKGIMPMCVILFTMLSMAFLNNCLSWYIYFDTVFLILLF